MSLTGILTLYTLTHAPYTPYTEILRQGDNGRWQRDLRGPVRGGKEGERAEGGGLARVKELDEEDVR